MVGDLISKKSAGAREPLAKIAEDRIYLKRLLLYSTYAIILALVILGILTSLWLWQVKDWGISVDWDGRVLSVQAGSRAASAGMVVGDYITFADAQELKRLSGQVQVGDHYTLTVSHDGQARTVTLEAQPSTLKHRIDLSVNAWVGICFVLLGVAPLIARRRDFTLWMFFIATEVIGLFLITVIPRSMHIFLAELTAYITLSFFPAVLFHFHTLFPRRKLGNKRRPIVVGVYIIALIILPFNISGLWDYAFYVSDLWAVVIQLYIAGSLLACLTLLIHSFFSTHEKRVRSQVKIISICSGIGLLVNAALLLPSLLFNLEVTSQLMNLAVITALTTPIGYAYSMLRYDVLIDGLLWRRWLLRAVLSSLLFICAVVIAVSLTKNDSLNSETAIETALATWILVALGAIVIGVLSTILAERIEEHLFKGSSYLALLEQSTSELERFQTLADYVHFFVETLPARLKVSGAMVFLAQEGEDKITLRGYSTSLEAFVSKQGLASIDVSTTLREVLQTTHALVPLTALLATHTQNSASEDARLLHLLQDAGMEQLVSLVSRQHERLIGLVALAGKETDESFSTQETSALTALASTASTAAENVLLFEELQKQLTDLKREREYRLELTRQANAAQEDERKRIARDIHDSPLQEMALAIRSLTSLRENVGSILATGEDLAADAEIALAESWPEFAAVLDGLMLDLNKLLGDDVNLLNEAEPTIEGLISQVELAERYTREICNNLHPTYLDQPLQRILSDSVEGLKVRAANAGVAVKLHAEGEEPVRLGDDLKMACKQIMEQAINNALVHAAPSEIDVELIFNSGAELVLSVRDNGCGFVVLAPRAMRSLGHHGLPNMAERADLLGGQLVVESQIDKGTSVTVRIPGQPLMIQDSPPPSQAFRQDRLNTDPSARLPANTQLRVLNPDSL